MSPCGLEFRVIRAIELNKRGLLGLGGGMN